MGHLFCSQTALCCLLQLVLTLAVENTKVTAHTGIIKTRGCLPVQTHSTMIEVQAAADLILEPEERMLNLSKCAADLTSFQKSTISEFRVDRFPPSQLQKRCKSFQKELREQNAAVEVGAFAEEETK